MITEWNDCYGDSWKGIITPESFAHPAKYSKALIERIFDHCLERGWLERGDLVGDPFGGVGNGGIAAAYRGLRWVGLELESRFVGFAKGNFEMHEDKWRTMGLPLPVILQGDSRKFHEALIGAGAVVTSPPYVDSMRGLEHNGIDVDKLNANNHHAGKSSMASSREIYGKSDGQIARMPAGNVSAVVTSPHYAHIAAGAGGINTKPAKHDGQQSGRNGKSASQDTNQRYGDAPGQIAGLPEGEVDCVVTSPPYGETLDHGGGPDTKQDYIQGGKSLMGIKEGYGDSPAQIRGSGETYWQAMAQVYASCYLAIRPGGIIAVVVKDYVSKKKRVTLCDDTALLLEHCGFEIVERVHAMLTKETRHSDLFTGETVTTKSRKSFFRRLAEKKGSPPIDFEEVIFCRRNS